MPSGRGSSREYHNTPRGSDIASTGVGAQQAGSRPRDGKWSTEIRQKPEGFNVGDSKSSGGSSIIYLEEPVVIKTAKERLHVFNIIVTFLKRLGIDEDMDQSFSQSVRTARRASPKEIKELAIMKTAYEAKIANDAKREKALRSWVPENVQLKRVRTVLAAFL
jgi:hypothetical protein